MKNGSKIGGVLIGAAIMTPLVAPSRRLPAQPLQFTDTFATQNSDFSSSGSNPFFILQPGYEQTYEGVEDDEKVHLTITVTHQTKRVNGVETRVVVERETHDGKLVEVSQNYFVISRRDNSVFYFGEHVDNYSQGKITNHGGSWLAGVWGARPGLMMPGIALLGARYFQEVAPGAAMDRAEILSLSETLKTPAGEFKRCLKTQETSPLEPGSKEYKLYAPGVGLIKAGALKLMKVSGPRQ